MTAEQIVRMAYNRTYNQAHREEKRVKNKEYYRKNRERILSSKRSGGKVVPKVHLTLKDGAVSATDPPERQRKRNKAFNRRCFICGGPVLPSGPIWQCMNPECEMEFQEL